MLELDVVQNANVLNLREAVGVGNGAGIGALRGEVAEREVLFSFKYLYIYLY